MLRDSEPSICPTEFPAAPRPLHSCATRANVATDLLQRLGTQLRGVTITGNNGSRVMPSRSLHPKPHSQSAPSACTVVMHSAHSTHSMRPCKQARVTNLHGNRYPKVWVLVAMPRSHDAASRSGLQHLSLTMLVERKSPAPCRSLGEVRPLRRSSVPRSEASDGCSMVLKFCIRSPDDFGRGLAQETARRQQGRRFVNTRQMDRFGR